MRRGIDEGIVADTVLRGRGDEVDHIGHFVQLFRADIWAVGEAEVDLHEEIDQTSLPVEGPVDGMRNTHQTVAPFHVLISKCLSILI